MLCNASLRFLQSLKAGCSTSNAALSHFYIYKMWNYNFQLNVMQHMWIRQTKAVAKHYQRWKNYNDCNTE